MRVESTAGLKLKLPAPFQTIARFDGRLFALVPPPREFLTLGKQNVVATGFILWRVHDPAKFMQTVFDRVGAESRLGDILFAELGAALGGAPFAAFVSTAPGEYRAEAVLADMTRQYRELALRDYGIDVVDVRLRRLDFPEQNRASVFARMKSERVRISMQYRSEGEEEGLKIRAAAEKAKSGILGEAYKLSQQIRGEGEARAAKIYGESLTRCARLLPLCPLSRRHEKDRRQGHDLGAAGRLRPVPPPAGQSVPLPGGLIVSPAPPEGEEVSTGHWSLGRIDIAVHSHV